MSDAEERFNVLISSANGHRKIQHILEQVLYNNVPSFILSVKGKKQLYDECMVASITIVNEEVAKGKDDLYNRLRRRIDNYWEK